MKKNLLLAFASLSLLLTTGCKKTTIITPHKTYKFNVIEHKIAISTSEVQEHTHDMYLAYCTSGANECYIEVPVNDTRTELELYNSGYIITYTLNSGLTSKKVSNNGWELVCM